MSTILTTAPQELQDKIVLPGDRRYAMLRSTYTTVAEPAAVLVPTTTAEVVAALRFAREQGLPLAVRSGGHGLTGRSSNNGGIVIDLSALNQVGPLDPRTRLVRIEAGARWATVAETLAPYGLAISSGDHGNVGVGGLAIGGGIGWMVRRHGLTIDNVRAVEVVLADGRVVRADAEHEPDLFWGARGAGAGIGIVVAFEIEAAEVAKVQYGQIVVQADRDGHTVHRWADYLATASRDLSTAVMLQADGNRFVMSITAVITHESPHRAKALLEPLLGIGTKVLGQGSGTIPYPALVSTAHLHPNVGQQPSISTNGLLSTVTSENARAVMDTLAGPAPVLMQLRSVGGAVNDMPADATAYAHRHQSTLAVASVFPPQRRAELDAAWRPLAGHVDGAYIGFEGNPDRAAFDRIYPGATGARVAELWQRYDPDGVFRPPFCSSQGPLEQSVPSVPAPGSPPGPGPAVRSA